MRRPLLIIAGIVLGALAVHWFDPPAMAPKRGDAIGEVRAELTDGQVFQLAQPPNEVVVVNFWATWCLPCQKEVPILNALHAEGTRIVGLAIDTIPLASLSQHASALGIRYPVGQGAPGLAERLGVQAVPTTFVVGKDGRIALAEAGGLSRAELSDAIAAAQRR